MIQSPNQDELDELDKFDDPFDIFSAWYKIASEKEKDPTYMYVSTVDEEGRPNIRTVLLKEYGKDGFVFFTNIESKKGREIQKNSFVAVLFWWQNFGRQVKIRGRAERISESEADEYFKTRPRFAQIAAWASRQSQPINSYKELIENFKKYEKEFEGKEVPRPPYWLGFRIIPYEFEFLIYTTERLHKRALFYLEGGRWKKAFLCP
jgi:pyridoxamine 5'-phosphate oxidase